MESGVEMILSDLTKATERGVPVRNLTGNYLGITQPSALYMIRRELGDKVDLRFYSDKYRSFHPKSYFFHYNNYMGCKSVLPIFPEAFGHQVLSGIIDLVM